ncbi:MAG: Lipopolysaccharide export system ATP-binding protein LptB [Gammaproteobacteria bacterium]|nr:Lipopolysaccharide export system ATP-binding protein LptB [Gammaproteobacteria bacterium]
MSTLGTTHLCKEYKGLQVVDHVNVEVSNNEVVGLLGPNGAGKTTCFYMIVGLIRHDSGEIYLDEYRISDLPMHERARLGIGYLPQEPSVFRKLTVADNIAAVLEAQPGLGDEDIRHRVSELLEAFGISHKRDALGISLSGGERRRVEIARALSVSPHFILLDEPFAGIDPISIGDIQNIIAYLRDQGIGVLITDHNVQETLGICDRAYILTEGRVFASGTPEDIVVNADVRQVYLGENFRL